MNTNCSINTNLLLPKRRNFTIVCSSLAAFFGACQHVAIRQVLARITCAAEQFTFNQWNNCNTNELINYCNASDKEMRIMTDWARGFGFSLVAVAYWHWIVICSIGRGNFVIRIMFFGSAFLEQRFTNIIFSRAVNTVAQRLLKCIAIWMNEQW